MAIPPSYKQFLAKLRAGHTFYFGDWRDLWRREHPMYMCPAEYPKAWIPRGLSYIELTRDGTPWAIGVYRLYPR